METFGLILIGLAVLAGLGAWGVRQWRKGRLVHVPFLPKPPATATTTTEASKL